MGHSVDLDSIYGLRWEANRRLENGLDSYVVPIATTRPVTIVFHGEKHFSYGHYGIHLGQEDRLTFLGSKTRTITARFIDCRRDSPTLHRRVVSTFAPDSGRRLCIPPGIAHAFDSLEGIFTINAYNAFLPSPDDWLSGKTEWTIENDVVNVPMDITDSELPVLSPNEHEASEVFYQLVAEHQRATIPNLDHEYPYTEDVTFGEGHTRRLLFKKVVHRGESPPEWTPIETIAGAGWGRHPFVRSGDESGFVLLLDARPLYFVDHGEETPYTHDAYGIHTGQEDRLTFLGPADHQIRLTMVDCRVGSATQGARATIDITPNACKYLRIPNGVAHRFENLERVFTVNRPAVFLPEDAPYEPGNDVIDWPADREDFPSVLAHKIPATQEFYLRQADAQRQALSEPSKHATPMVLMVPDIDGRAVRVALRKLTEA